LSCSRERISETAGTERRWLNCRAPTPAKKQQHSVLLCASDC
jgi:hypothetical protein